MENKINLFFFWFIILVTLIQTIQCLPFENANSDGSGTHEDMSIYGNTDESFFDFANRRVNELKTMSESLFDKSLSSCPYTPLDLNEHPQNSPSNNKCLVGSLSLNSLHGKSADRIFLIDELTIGVVSSSDSSVSFYSINMPGSLIE